MGTGKNINWKNYIVSTCLGLFVLITAILGLWEKAELGFYDAWFNLRGKESPGNQIIIIAMDEKSIGKIGPFPWSREIHARLLEKLKQAKAVGLDIFFDAPTDKKADTALARAIKEHGRVILASMFTFEQDKGGVWFQQLKKPFSEFTKKAVVTGFINMPAEKGNMVRSVTVIDSSELDRLYPSFSLAVAMFIKGFTPDNLSYKDGFLTADNLNIPLNDLNQTLIDFWGPSRTFPTYSYIDVLEGRVKPDAWKDKIVLVGIDTPTERDYFENPFTKGNLILSGALPVPGVEIHASAVKTYLTGRYFQRALWYVNLAFLITAFLATLLTARRSPWQGLFFTFIVAFVLLSIAYLLWLKLHYWLNVAAPLAMVITTYVGVTVENIVRTEIERRKIKTLFGRYVSSQVVEELLRQPEKIDLGGIKQEATILFSDIRGFTAFSEGKPPEEIVARLNEYFTAMTEVVFRQGGMLDKYLGDGLMAVFGAPVAYPDHARRAIIAAVEMLERLEGLNRSWQEKGEAALGIGIGINSGGVVVGNIGSPERMDYTVIGEEVNLASRLEGMNKEYGTRIIISERTVRYLEEGDIISSWKLVGLGEAKVRGMIEPVKIYTLIY